MVAGVAQVVQAAMHFTTEAMVGMAARVGMAAVGHMGVMVGVYRSMVDLVFVLLKTAPSVTTLQGWEVMRGTVVGAEMADQAAQAIPQGTMVMAGMVGMREGEERAGEFFFFLRKS
jgi:hypothetical protein